MVPGAAITGALITRLGKIRWAVWGGWALVTLTTGLLILFDQDFPIPSAVAIASFWGLGHAMLLSAQNFVTQAIALPGDEGPAANMYIFLRNFGAAIGVGIGGSVFQNIAIIRLDDFDLPRSVASNVEFWIEEIYTNPPRTAAEDQIIDALSMAFKASGSSTPGAQR